MSRELLLALVLLLSTLSAGCASQREAGYDSTDEDSADVQERFVQLEAWKNDMDQRLIGRAETEWNGEPYRDARWEMEANGQDGTVFGVTTGYKCKGESFVLQVEVRTRDRILLDQGTVSMSCDGKIHGFRLAVDEDGDARVRWDE